MMMTTMVEIMMALRTNDSYCNPLVINFAMLILMMRAMVEIIMATMMAMMTTTMVEIMAMMTTTMTATRPVVSLFETGEPQCQIEHTGRVEAQRDLLEHLARPGLVIIVMMAVVVVVWWW